MAIRTWGVGDYRDQQNQKCYQDDPGTDQDMRWPKSGEGYAMHRGSAGPGCHPTPTTSVHM